MKYFLLLLSAFLLACQNPKEKLSFDRPENEALLGLASPVQLDIEAVSCQGQRTKRSEQKGGQHRN